MFRLFFLSSFLYMITACSLGSEPVPGDHFYRLPEIHIKKQAEPFIDTLVIKPVKASGLYHERAMLYVESSRPLEVQRHHYHFWLKPPADLINAALYQGLSSSGIAKNIQREVSAGAVSSILASRISQFERLISDKQVTVQLGLDVTLKHTGVSTVLWSKHYQVSESSTGRDIHDSAEAYGRAIQQIVEQIAKDLALKK